MHVAEADEGREGGRKKRKGVKPTATDCGEGGVDIRGASSSSPSSSTVEKWKGGDNHLTKVGERRGGRGVKKFRRTYGLAAAAVVLGGTLSLSLPPSWLLSPLSSITLTSPRHSPSPAISPQSAKPMLNGQTFLFLFRPNFPFFQVGPFQWGGKTNSAEQSNPGIERVRNL